MAHTPAPEIGGPRLALTLQGLDAHPPARRSGGGSQWRSARLRQRGCRASEPLFRAGKIGSLPWPQGALWNLRRKQLGARCPRAGAHTADVFHPPQSLPDFGVRAEMRDWRRKETRPWADAHAGKTLAYSSRRRHLGPHFAGEQTKRGTDKVIGNERVNWSPDCKPGLVGTRIRALPPRPTARWRGESLGTPWAAELPLYLLGAKA